MTSPRRSSPPVVQRRWSRWCIATTTASVCAFGVGAAAAQTRPDALAAADPATPAPTLAAAAPSDEENQRLQSLLGRLDRALEQDGQLL